MNKSVVRQILAISCTVGAVGALLVAPIADATKPSNKQLCQNNLRVIWRALKAYQQDNMMYPPIDDGRIPLRAWCDYLFGYGLTAEDCTCPSQDLQKEVLQRTLWGFPEYKYGYALNASAPTGYSYGGASGTLPVESDRLLLVADGYWAWFAYDDSDNPDGVTSPGDQYVPDWWSNKVAWRHPGPEPYSSTKAAGNFLTAGGQVVYLRRYVNTNQYSIVPTGGSLLAVGDSAASDGASEGGAPMTSLDIAAREAAKR